MVLNDVVVVLKVSANEANTYSDEVELSLHDKRQLFNFVAVRLQSLVYACWQDFWRFELFIDRRYLSEETGNVVFAD